MAKLPMIVGPGFLERYGDDLRRTADSVGLDLDLIVLPGDPEARIAPEDRERAEVALFSNDIHPVRARQFFSAALGATNLKWMHVFNAGTDDEVFSRFTERGVRLSTSSGSTAEPIAQTAFAGLLMLARRFPIWLENQRQQRWEPIAEEELIPSDLQGQTVVVLGLGEIGKQFARYAQAFGMRVIGIRRRPIAPGDPVDEMATPAHLLDMLPTAHWLMIAAPLTAETRGMIDAQALAAMPFGSYVLNVGRGEIIDEAALVESLQSGHTAGAYLDVFHQEPLPAESPFWGLPNVIVTPHNSAISRGNPDRVAHIFLDNLVRFARGEKLHNEVH